jgi:hypothetical protein
LTLQATPYNLVQGDEVEAIVTASNSYGESAASEIGSGAVIILVPYSPVGLADNTAVTNAARIGLTWNNGLNTGGSPIISYRVTYDQSTGTWTTLATGVLTRSYTTTVVLTPGAFYKFRVEALNSVGYSIPSASFEILCAQPPDKPAAPRTTFSELNVVVAWDAPPTGGSQILSYTIRFRQSDGTTYTEDTAICNGGVLATVNARSCTIPSVRFTTTPYNIQWGQSIWATVVATNIKGSSLVSEGGNGAVILTNPAAPILLRDVPTITTGY